MADIFLYVVIGEGKQVPQVVGEDFAAVYVGLIAEGLHLVQDIAAV